jgi:TIR domain
MPIFISYSHADRVFVNKLAASLVKHNAHVWIDSWELNVGDSIVSRVQEAIKDSSALLVVLSKASVASEWCKKELNAGLMRELDEKRVLVLPVLVDDCEIPVFLREKLYADFRGKFDVGLKALVEAVSKVTSLDQGRIKSVKGNIDWSETWGDDGEFFRMEYTLIETLPDCPFTLLTEVSLKCNEEATHRYNEYAKAGFDWLGRTIITEALAELAGKETIDILLTDHHPVVAKYRLVDNRSATGYDIVVRCRRMGEDNGKDQLVHVTNYLHRIKEYIRQRVRKLSPEEAERAIKIASSR